MSPDSEQQNDILFQEALEAETSSDWSRLRTKCEQGLKMEGLAPSREALFRRLHGKALYLIATARSEAYDANLLKEAIEEAKKVVAIYSHPEHYPSYGPHLMAELHAICGDASYALSMTPSGSGQKGELIVQAIEQYEKSLQIEPQNKKIREMLDHVQKHPAAIKQQKGACFIATAAYGSPQALEVMFFRQFRDDVLLPSGMGRAFVGFYYFVSPRLASLISKHQSLQVLTRRFLLEPILHRLKIGRETGYGRPNDWRGKTR
jgi:hypothetical protein